MFLQDHPKILMSFAHFSADPTSDAKTNRLGFKLKKVKKESSRILGLFGSNGTTAFVRSNEAILNYLMTDLANHMGCDWKEIENIEIPDNL